MMDWRDVLDGKSRVCVVEDDCVEAMAAMPEASVDAVVCEKTEAPWTI